MKQIEKFIKNQKEWLEQSNYGIDWSSDKWITTQWLPHRGLDRGISFKVIRSSQENTPAAGSSIPSEILDFFKALIVYMQRKRDSGFIATKNYVMELRRLYSLIMFSRNEDSPMNLTFWHFNELLETRKRDNYKNIYDAAVNIKLIADTIDSLNLLESSVDFEHLCKPEKSYYRIDRLSKIDDDNHRDDTKMPSMQAFEAYAYCSNNPISENEEVLLRTIDLLIAMGQRGNEVTCIPLDCWTESETYDDSGEIVKDSQGNPIKSYGIRYFAEKQFKPRIHYLSDYDVPFAKRAIERLKTLTEETRSVAKWQESNPGKIWNFESEIINDDLLISILRFKTVKNLHLFLKRNEIPVIIEDTNPYRDPPSNGQRRIIKRNWYNVRHLDEKLNYLVPDHNDFGVIMNGKKETILKTSEILSIGFEGALSIKNRRENIYKIRPRRLSIRDLNNALGTTKISKSIFDVRELTEANGDRIKLSTHSFRHWRNTIYHLTGMTDVQQALALGRQDLSQNPYYQHTTLKEKTEKHRLFHLFNSSNEKLSYLKNGIKKGSISGPLQAVYTKIKREQNSETAEEFLNTHANALHITPYGGCTHDYSQSPCTKYLQCWNGCLHLHRTGNPEETKRLNELRKTLEISLVKIKLEQSNATKWVMDLETKIENLKNAINLEAAGGSLQVFPNGRSMAPLPKISSVKSENE